MIEHLQASVNADPALVRRGRWVNLDFVLGVGDEDWLVSIEFGRVTGVERRRLATRSGRFSIRARRCPVYLLSGEYDSSCTPERMLATAGRIKGARAVVMSGIGHFPMSENPALFRTYLLPVLEEIRRGMVEGCEPSRSPTP